MTENTTEAPVSTTEVSEKAKNEPRKCECSLFEVLTNLREAEDGSGLICDEEFTTGCSGVETKNLFAPGHDAKLKSFLIRMGVAGHDVGRSDGIRTENSAEGWAAEYGFAAQVLAGIRRAEEKVAAKAVRDSLRASKKAAAEQAKADKKAAAALAKAQQAATPAVETAYEADGALVLAKVGRWEYIGRITDSPEFGLRFTYEDKQGVSQTTTDFKMAETEPAAV